MKRIPSHKIKQFISLPDGEIDLHGLFREEAIKELADFLYRAESLHWQSVKVITGRGLNSPGGVSVVKQATETWLRTHNYQYKTAKGKEGGPGSIIVSIH